MDPSRAPSGGRVGLLSFLDPASRVALLAALSGEESPGVVAPSPLLAPVKKSVELAAVSWLQGCSRIRPPSTGRPGGEAPDVATDLSTLPILRGEAASWADVLDEAGSWAAMREVAAAEGVALPPDAALLGLFAQLRVAEDAAVNVYPSCTLYYSRVVRLGNSEILSWRRRIVRWLRALSSKHRLTATTVTEGVAVADCYLARFWGPGPVAPEELQLYYFVSLLCAAAGAPESLAAVLASAPQYSLEERDATEERLRECMAEPASGGGAVTDGDALREVAACVPRPVGGVAGRMPSLVASATRLPPPRLLGAIKAAQPIAFAGPLISMLPADWAPIVLPHVLEALYIAMLEVDLHRFSPQTIAVAAVHGALQVSQLLQHPVATLWLVLAHRALHVDPASVRLCALDLRAVSLSRDTSALRSDRADSDTVVLAATLAIVQHLSTAGGAVTLRPSSSAARDLLVPAPVTSGRGAGLLARLHPRTFIEAVALEAEMRGAEADVVEELVAEAAAGPEKLARAVVGTAAVQGDARGRSTDTSVSAAKADTSGHVSLPSAPSAASASPPRGPPLPIVERALTGATELSAAPSLPHPAAPPRAVTRDSAGAPPRPPSVRDSQSPVSPGTRPFSGILNASLRVRVEAMGWNASRIHSTDTVGSGSLSAETPGFRSRAATGGISGRHATLCTTTPTAGSVGSAPLRGYRPSKTSIDVVVAAAPAAASSREQQQLRQLPALRAHRPSQAGAGAAGAAMAPPTGSTAAATSAGTGRTPLPLSSSTDTVGGAHGGGSIQAAVSVETAPASQAEPAPPVAKPPRPAQPTAAPVGAFSRVNTSVTLEAPAPAQPDSLQKHAQSRGGAGCCSVQ